jgi:hypothetical protein
MTTEQRVERLEREIRWMRRIGAVTVAIAAVVFLVGQSHKNAPRDLVGRSLALKDNQGRIRLRAVADHDEQDPGLQILDQKGNERLRMALGRPGPYLTLRDELGNARVLVAWANGGKPTPFIALLDEDNIERFEVGFWEGRPFLALRNERARPRVVALTKEDGSPDLSLFGKNDKIVWRAPED